MTIAPPSRLRSQRALPEPLRHALCELPNHAPAPAQLDELRRRLGLAASSAEARELPSPVSHRRSKERRLRRTVVALLFFPIAATAAVSGVMAIGERLLSRSAAPVSTAGVAPVHVSRARAAPTPLPVAPSATQTAAEPVVSEAPRAAAPRSAAAESELALLQRANAALKSDPAQALALAGQHEARFPAGNLAQEGEVIAIKALLALGDSPRAKARLLRFESSYPRSIHALELQQLVP